MYATEQRAESRPVWSRTQEREGRAIVYIYIHSIYIERARERQRDRKEKEESEIESSRAHTQTQLAARSSLIFCARALPVFGHVWRPPPPKDKLGNPILDLHQTST